MPAIAVLLVSAMLCVLAVVYRGVEVTQVSVDDGGIWVTNQDRKLLGHLNYDALMLDGTVSVKSASFDIGQAGGDVTLGETVSAYGVAREPTSFSIGQAVTLPEDAIQVQGGSVLAVLDPTAGLLWVGNAGRTRLHVVRARGRGRQRPERRRRHGVAHGHGVRILSRVLQRWSRSRKEGQTWRAKTTEIKDFTPAGHRRSRRSATSPSSTTRPVTSWSCPAARYATSPRST